jgi:hypothetical protein
MRPRFHAIEFSFKESASGPSGMPCGRVLPFMKKSNKSVRCASEYKTRNKIQRGAGALLGEIDGASYIADEVCRRQPQGAERELQLGR